MENIATYPEWHQLPFSLTNAELINPKEVVEEFCWQFSLSEIRTLLKEWYAASLSDDVADSKSIFITYTALEKLIEAIYQINKMETPEE
ncbi:hypothetical protein SAMN05444266_105382 [Chitinophaga jiangningensis]|uniref:Uncharacterized protein n=1 Tax=Chitinophaga jiangningensis TaxID=1419482 RepID=A0A1M7ECC3_9BACT|nr:hypothetical protein [Chitinophaga jiangningensis]SHL89394.1 hypothetical protein SAMN05444266_105382 [Chitinophaga jiangningensis]